MSHEIFKCSRFIVECGRERVPTTPHKCFVFMASKAVSPFHFQSADRQPNQLSLMFMTPPPLTLSFKFYLSIINKKKII